MPETKADWDVLAGKKKCPRVELHTLWDKTAVTHRELSKTQKLEKCPGCGLFQIWVTK